MGEPVVLGLHAAAHDTGATLIGKKGFLNIAQERLTRKKHDGGFPYHAIQYLLEEALSLSEIDLVVFDKVEAAEEVVGPALHRLGFQGKVLSISHHDAHAASAFFASPFEEAAVLVVDALGSLSQDGAKENSSAFSFEVQSFYYGQGFRLRPLKRVFLKENARMGIGIFYELATLYLGFGPLEAGKVMGLAGYGEGVFKREEHMFSEEFLIPTGSLSDGGKEYDGLSWFSRPENLKKLSRLFFGVSPRKPGEVLKRNHAELAFFVQQETELAMLRAGRKLYELTKCPRLCLAGGVALNCLANRKILEQSPFQQIFIQPAANDAGISLGCALFGYHVVFGQPRQPFNVYSGRAYDEKKIREMLSETPEIIWHKADHLAQEVAIRIAKGEIVGWFQGRSELGPRALGNRSILADPRDPKMKAKLNQRVKKREPFRPYAPAVLEEHAAEYFDLISSPFMLLTAKVKREKEHEIPAVVHVDGTARLQTVSQRMNPKFYDLIYAFYRRTGVPILLNTSFNGPGEPIVETPEDALTCFLKTEMDLLVIGDFVIEKSKISPSLHKNSIAPARR